jgi:hypothetical protein
LFFSQQKSHARKNRMAEIASPASDPRSLRRHYPHQVQGVVQLDLSAIAAPPHFYLVQNKTPLREVNDRQNCRPSVMDVPANLERNCDSAVETFRNAVSRQAAIGLPI